MITPHVATEVSNLATSLNSQDHRQFFELFAGYLRHAKELSANSLPSLIRESHIYHDDYSNATYTSRVLRMGGIDIVIASIKPVLIKAASPLLK